MRNGHEDEDEKVSVVENFHRKKTAATRKKLFYEKDTGASKWKWNFNFKKKGKQK